MEKEGLIRCVRFFEELEMTIGSLITDRHPAIQKWVRENLPETKHFYDVWHVAKGKFGHVISAKANQIYSLKNQL